MAYPAIDVTTTKPAMQQNCLTLQGFLHYSARVIAHNFTARMLTAAKHNISHRCSNTSNL